MHIDIDDEDAKVLAHMYPSSNDYRETKNLVLQRLCQQVRDKMPKPFKKGDIVHVSGNAGVDSWCERMEVIAVARDGDYEEQAWCRDGDGDLGEYATADLAYGIRP